jgi:N-acyl-D-amino-acid deacylase
MYDLIIKEGKVVTGTGSPWINADVGIRNGKIVKVGYIKGGQADTIIYARGKYVVPGFIDTHNHSDFSIFQYPAAENLVRQGITTILVGHDGFSAAPIMSIRIDDFRKYWKQLVPNIEIRPTWTSFSEYLDSIERVKPAINIASLVGHGTIRLNVMGFENREPTKEELNEMKELARDAMREGAFGMSTGLIYPPSAYASTEELIELSKVIAEGGGIYVTHLRSESYGLFDSLKEAIRIGKEANIPVHISHHKITARELWGSSIRTLKMFEEMRKEGIDITCDVYPYTAGMTMLSAVLPKWAHEGGIKEMLSRLSNNEIRKKIIDYIESVSEGWENFIKLCGWGNIYIAQSRNRKEFEGKNIMQISNELGKDPYDVIFDLLIEDEATTTMISFRMSEKDVDRIVTHRLSNICTDSWSTSGGGKVHPRFYGAFPKVLRRYVIDMNAISFEEAIRKMTSQPAQRLGLFDRGMIVPGYYADIVVIDSAKIHDRASYDNPSLYPEGIDYVIINGEVVLENSQMTGRRPGEVLRLKH